MPSEVIGLSRHVSTISFYTPTLFSLTPRLLLLFGVTARSGPERSLAGCTTHPDQWPTSSSELHPIHSGRPRTSCGRRSRGLPRLRRPPVCPCRASSIRCTCPDRRIRSASTVATCAVASYTVHSVLLGPHAPYISVSYSAVHITPRLST